MTPAARLVACPRFRWLPGMRILPDAANKAARCTLATPEGRTVFAVEAPIQMARDNGGPSRLPQADGPVVEAWSDDALTGEELPDLDDPATIGALLGLVREVFASRGAADICATPRLDGAGWAAESHYPAGHRDAGQPNIVLGEGATEIEAWIAALEGAP